MHGRAPLEERAAREREQANRAQLKRWERETWAARMERSMDRTLAYLAGALLVWLLLGH
jgi:hypothetical protein